MNTFPRQVLETFYKPSVARISSLSKVNLNDKKQEIVSAEKSLYPVVYSVHSVE